MQLIKIENPNEEFLENTLTEKECDVLLSEINDILNSDKPINYSSLEEKVDLKKILTLGISATSAVTIIISMIIKWFKNTYTLNIKKLISQSKELNDIYNKVNDLLHNDKMARFKHRNDLVQATKKLAILKDKVSNKEYYCPIDAVAYDPSYILRYIDESVAKASVSENKKLVLNTYKDDLIRNIDYNFNKSHWFLNDTCEQMIKSEVFNNVRLEDSIMVMKDSIAKYYNAIAYANKYVCIMMQYVQITEKAYKSAEAKYKNDKDVMKIVDEIFKNVLKKMTMCINFDNGAINMMFEIIKFYAKELEKIYDLLKS